MKANISSIKFSSTDMKIQSNIKKKKIKEGEEWYLDLDEDCERSAAESASGGQEGINPFRSRHFLLVCYCFGVIKCLNRQKDLSHRSPSIKRSEREGREREREGEDERRLLCCMRQLFVDPPFLSPCAGKLAATIIIYLFKQIAIFISF